MKVILCLSVLALATVSSLAGQLSPNGDKTIVHLSKALIRLGEKEAAGQLLTHQAEKRLRFEAFTGRRALATAEVGAPFGNWGPANTNVLSISQVYEGYGPRVNPNRPWDPKMDWVGLSATMVHEQRHMLQYMPTRTPAHEDPAWRDQEAALQRWVGRLAKELDEAMALPASPDRLAELTEIGDLLRGVRGAAHTMEEGRGDYERDGWLTPRKAWTFAQTEAAADRLLRRLSAFESKAIPDLKFAPLVVPATGAWILSGTVVWSDNSGIQDGSLVAQYANSPSKAQGWVIPELSKHRWEHPNKEGNPVTSLSVSWSRPPDMIRPGTDVILKVKASDLGSTKGAGIEGDFVGFDPSLYVSDDGVNFRFVWQGRPALYANPGRFEEREFRLPIPATKSAVLCINIGTGNIFWGKTVTYQYKWKEGFKPPAKPAPKANVPKKKGGKKGG